MTERIHLAAPGPGMLEVVPANPETITIVRLYLERLPIMTDQERHVLVRFLEFLVAPTAVAE